MARSAGYPHDLGGTRQALHAGSLVLVLFRTQIGDIKRGHARHPSES